MLGSSFGGNGVHPSQVPRNLLLSSDDCAEEAEEGTEDATMMLLLDFAEEEGGKLLTDWEDEAGEADELAFLHCRSQSSLLM